MTLGRIHPDTKKQFIAYIGKVLYSKPRAEHELILGDIIWDHVMVSPNGTPGFYFKGELFNFEPIKKNVIHLVTNLKPFLHNRMQQYITDRDALAKEEALTVGYIRQILRKTSHADEIKALLPAALHNELETYRAAFLPGPGSLSPADIQAIKDEHQTYFRLITARMAYNFLEAASTQ